MMAGRYYVIIVNVYFMFATANIALQTPGLQVVLTAKITELDQHPLTIARGARAKLHFITMMAGQVIVHNVE